MMRKKKNLRKQRNINLLSLHRIGVLVILIIVIVSSTTFNAEPLTVSGPSISRNIVLYENQTIMNRSIEDTKLQDDILEATKLLESIMKKSYEKSVESVKKQIVENNYDYELTMETLNENGNPFANYDYTKLIAIYATLKAHNHINGLSDVEFVTANIEEESLEEYIPEKVDKYEKSENGKFQKTGVKYVNYKTTADTYTKKGDYYVKSGTQEITPKTATTKYGNVTFHILNPEDLFVTYGIEKTEKLVSEYKYRISLINQEITGTGLSQSVFINLQTTVDVDADTQNQIDEIYNMKIGNRKSIAETALKLIGKVPYEWGGKSSNAGYDSSWWTFTSEGNQKGLDCSGFVQWAYRTAGVPESVWSKMGNTKDDLKNLESISTDELEIGDLGLLNHGEKTNHVGIYLGNNYWIHCSSSKGTVVVQKDFPFTVYKKVPSLDTLKIDTPIEIVYYTNMTNFEDIDVYLASQLVANEARGEGLNGWIAVAEVLKNRLYSPDFPNTIKEIVYQNEDGHKQFADSEKISSMKPSDTMIKVVKETLAGNMSVLNNPNALFFRNANGDTGNWGTYSNYKTIENHTFYTVEEGEH